MAINADKMREKLAAANAKRGENKNQNNDWFKPKEGTQEVRVAPDTDDPFREYQLHYGLGEGFLCPKKNFNEACPVCDYASHLWHKDGSDDAKKQAKELFPRSRYVSNVYWRDSKEAPVQGPKPYGYGKNAYKQLLSLTLDPDYGDITDPTSGRWFSLTYAKATKAGEFPTTTLVVGGKESALSKDKKEVKELLDKVKPIESFMTRKTQAEIQTMLDKYIGSSADGSETSKYGGNSETESVPEDLDSAIEALKS